MALELTTFDAPTRQQAHEFQAVLFDDYVRIGIDESSAADMAFEGGNANPGQLMRRMAEGPKDYYGIRREGALVAVAAIGDWLYGDQAPFSYPLVTGYRRAMHRMHVRRGTEPVHDTGLHAFAVREGENYDEVAEPFIRDIRDIARRRGSAMLRASVDRQDDVLMNVLESFGGKPISSKHGTITIHGVERDHQLWGITLRQS